jgi:hypothetical protein
MVFDIWQCVDSQVDTYVLEEPAASISEYSFYPEQRATGSFETSVPIYKTTCHILEDYNLQFRFVCAS